jgi:integrase
MSRGQIIKRGDSWTVRIFLGRDAVGKRRYFNKTITGTKKDAQKYLTGKLREKDLGTFIEPASISLTEYLDKWLADNAKQKVRGQTYCSYDIMLTYVKDALGSRKLSDIKTLDIQKFYNALSAKGLSPRTVRYVHSVLSSALKQAVKWHILMQNPCDFCDLPRKTKTEMKCLNPAETVKFLAAAKNTRHSTLFRLAIETGLRPSEYLALQWKDFDMKRNVLSIRRSVIDKCKGGFEFDETKTPSSRRSVPVSQALAAELKGHRKKQLEARLKNGQGYLNLDLIFASEIGTPHQKKNIRDRHFKPILTKAKLPEIRLYDLRHTTATLLLSDGVNPKIVSERLGHASIVLTLDTYSHVLPTMQEDATARLENILKTG